MMEWNLSEAMKHSCSVCNVVYTSKKKARQCEKRPVERRKFKIGDRVRALEIRTCSPGRKYTVEGKVEKVIGPCPPNFEYESKWLGGDPERMASHVFLYRVKYRCPACDCPKDHDYFAPEIVKSKKKAKRK